MPTTSFDTLSNDARIWVYAADRALTDAEVGRIEHELQAFTTDWTSHGAALHAAASVFDHRFVVIDLDTHESSASGCSIDKSLRAVQQLEQGLQLSLTNRLFVWVVGPNGWEKWSVGSAKKAWENKLWPAETFLADTTASTKCAWLNSRRALPENSWLAKVR
ncbi:MAG: hypothetical protein RLZZ114_947 [Bacteroidota bacterium]